MAQRAPVTNAANVSAFRSNEGLRDIRVERSAPLLKFENERAKLFEEGLAVPRLQELW